MKALELTNSTVFHRGRQWKSSIARQQNICFIFQPDFDIKYHPKVQQNILLHSGMIMPNILASTNFLLSKNKSVLNILGYFLEQFQKCSKLISSSDNKKILLTTRFAMRIFFPSESYMLSQFLRAGTLCWVLCKFQAKGKEFVTFSRHFPAGENWENK